MPTRRPRLATARTRCAPSASGIGRHISTNSVDGTAALSDIRMRIVEAQEAERSRLAQEVHDGPAQALTNAIFQVEYIERVLDQDGRLARTELRFLRELLRRELGDVRSF